MRYDDWWTDGSMVNGGLPGDEHFIADAATLDDATRLTDAHNAALAASEPPADPVADLTEPEIERLAEALRVADFRNWTAFEVAEKIAPTVRAIFARLLATGSEAAPEPR